MYNPSFPSSNISQNANPSSFSDHPNSTSYNNFSYHDPGFELLGFDHPMFVDYTSQEELLSCLGTQAPMNISQEMTACSYGSSSSSHEFSENSHMQAFISIQAIECKKVMKRGKKGDGHAIAFRTKSEFENLDDGYKWTKYGKKMVKTNTNPRNYYKCSSEGCKVKKRVERDEQDNRYVLTTYEGVHNHESPHVLRCDTTPFPVLLSGWTWQP
ncbi:hypothetical protein Pfo_022080 [Paulownia fortunei]|nr:hypothetical protein Pfo_022080 [Paulownia fortunei]